MIGPFLMLRENMSKPAMSTCGGGRDNVDGTEIALRRDSTRAEQLRGERKHAKETSNDRPVLGCTRLYCKPGRYHGTLWWEYRLCQCRCREKSPCGVRCRYWHSRLGQNLAGEPQDHLCAAVSLPLGSYPGLSIF